MDLRYYLLIPFIVIIPLGISMAKDYYEVNYSHNQEIKKKWFLLLLDFLMFHFQINYFQYKNI